MEWLQIVTWWLILQAFGWAALPLAFRLFRHLPDHGYAFAKSLGLLLVSYLLWMGAMTGFLRNSVGGILSAFLVTALLSIGWYRRLPKEDRSGHLSILGFLRGRSRMVLTVEILFTVSLFLWATVRAFAADKIMPAGGEKFMEIAFLNGVLNSPQFPPLDPWLSGFAISYYYFGYIMMGLLTKLSAAAPGVGFDLSDAMLFSLTVVGAFGIVYNLVATGSRGTGRTVARAWGLVGALFVAVLGNLEGLLEALHSKGVLSESLLSWINVPGLASAPVSGTFNPGTTGGWWWWRASRVLADDPINANPLNSITEFPFFSFLLGDNHPHVLALPFVLLAIALAFNLLLSLACESDERTVPTEPEAETTLTLQEWNPILFAFRGDWFLFLLYALCLGSLGFLNTWDMPIYIGLLVLAYGIAEYSRSGTVTSETVLRSLALGAATLLGAVALYTLFYLGFRSQAGGVLPFVLPPTRLPQYLVIFGTFLVIFTGFLTGLVLRQVRSDGARRTTSRFFRLWLAVAAVPIALFGLTLLVLFFTDVGRSLVSRALSVPGVQQSIPGDGLGAVLGAILSARLSDPFLFLVLTVLLALILTAAGRASDRGQSQSTAFSLSPVSLFVLLLAFVGLALTLMTEFFYLRDNFGMRMNTVFKFYYQAWVLLGCASAYSLWWLFQRGRRVLGRSIQYAFISASLLLISASMVYPVMATISRVQGFQTQPDLNGAANVARNNSDDWAAIQWLRENAPSGPYPPIILETPGASYNYEGRISAFTGYPTLLGWGYHELQWRGSYDEQSRREPEIITIYTTGNGAQALELLQKWEVEYVIVGESERRYIQQQCTTGGRSCNPARALQKFDAVLEPVFQQGETTIYVVPLSAPGQALR